AKAASRSRLIPSRSRIALRFPARSHDRFRLIHVAIARFKFRLQLYSEMIEVDQFPSQETPSVLIPIVLDPDDQMMRVVIHFIRFVFRLEIKSPEAAGATSLCVKLRIEITNTPRLFIDKPQVGVA